MLDENSLSKIIDKSIDPDGLKHYLGISVDPSGDVDWGSFYGLEENCCVSLGIGDLHHDKRNPDEIEKILNAYKIPAVSIHGEYDASKILVTDTGIKLPLQKPEDAIAQISDIVNVLKINNVNIEGYAHPVTKDELTRSTSARTNVIDCSQFDDDKIKEILERRQTTYDEFVGDRLDEAMSKAMSSEDIKDMAVSKYMQSIYRGGTLGNQPYATVADRECKDFVYASPSFRTAMGYARGLGASYKTVKGHRYGFIYEYESKPNQKFTQDFGLEEGQDKLNAETLEQKWETAYETTVYPHQNRLKGIYLFVDRQIYKIADQNGYISKEWEDFANLHPTRSMPSNPSEITRNNEMHRLSEQGGIASEYKGKTYDLTSQSLDSYIKEHMSTDAVRIGNDGKYVTSYPLIFKDIPDGADLSGLESCYLLGNVTIGKNVKLPEEVSISGTIPDGADLSHCRLLKLHDITSIGKDVKLPEVVSIEGNIPYETDLSGAKEIRLGSEVYFGEDIKLPENVILPSDMRAGGYIPDGMDLSHCCSLELHDITSIGKDVKLPEVVSIEGNIPDGADLSHCRSLELHEINIGKDVKLPEVVSIEGNIPSGADLSSAKEIRLNSSEVRFGKNIKLPKNVILPLNMEVRGTIPDGMDLSHCDSLTLHDITNIGKDVKLPEVVSISGNIPDGADLSHCSSLTLRDITNIGKDVKLPETISLLERSGDIPDGADLSHCSLLMLHDITNMGKDVKLPEEVSISGTIPDGTDLSGAKEIRLGSEVKFGKDIKLPENVSFSEGSEISGYIPDNTDLSKIENLSISEEVTFGKDVKLPKDVKFNLAKVSGYIPDGTNLGHSTLTGDVWLGKDCQYDYGCINCDNPPRIYGHAECNGPLQDADFSKAESLTFTKNSQAEMTAEITKDFIFPENGNVKIEGLVSVDCLETIHKISQYDVDDCIVFYENKDNSINSLPDNIDILIADEKDYKITAISKNAEGQKHLQELYDTMLSGSQDVDGTLEVCYLTQEEAHEQLGVQFTDTKLLKKEARIAELRGISKTKASHDVTSEDIAVLIQTQTPQMNASIPDADKAKIAELRGISKTKPSTGKQSSADTNQKPTTDLAVQLAKNQDKSR